MARTFTITVPDDIETLQEAVAFADAVVTERTQATPEKIETAREIARDFTDSDIQIDDDAVISEASYGVWVSAWIYIPN